MSEFGKRLRQLRRDKDITMVELANALGTTQPTISKYERGIHGPDLAMVEMVAKYFNVSTDYLVGKTDEKKPYYMETDKYIKELRQMMLDKGYDISRMTNEEIADKLIKAFKLDEIYKND